jgi:hypothetical protein
MNLDLDRFRPWLVLLSRTHRAGHFARDISDAVGDCMVGTGRAGVGRRTKRSEPCPNR